MKSNGTTLHKTTARFEKTGHSGAIASPLREAGERNITPNDLFDTASLLSPPHSLFRKEPEHSRPQLKIVILGLSITSSWGNGHATTYRGLVRELSARGHDVLFLERDVPWYASNRDLPNPPYGRTELYSSLKGLKHRYAEEIQNADLVIVGSYVTEGIAIGEWVTHTAEGVTAFYDIDTPVTIAHLNNGGSEYISKELIPRYQMYLSFSGGPILDQLEDKFGSPMARPLYCSVDPQIYFPEERPHRWDLGYMGTYSHDRQRALDRLLLEPARRWTAGRFAVAGPQYPETISWPKNVKRIEHIAPSKHRTFYNSQRFTLNITRANMIAAGYSPSVRLFEAAACGIPIVSDHWAGLDQFFTPDEEILISNSADQTLIYLEDIRESQRVQIGTRARERVLARHTARHRAIELENYALEVLRYSK
jgi:spore maturation protein CgeB